MSEVEPSDFNPVDFSVASVKEKVARIEAYIEELSVAASNMLTSWIVRLRREMSLLVNLEVVLVAYSSFICQDI